MVLPMMAASQRPLADVHVFGIQRRGGDRNRRSWVVRWAVRGRQRSRSFRTRAEADRYRSGLLAALQSGEAFDEGTGEPVAWQPAPGDEQAHLWARRWVAEQWPEWAPRTRDSALEALARFIPLLARHDSPPPPAGTRREIQAWLVPGSPVGDDDVHRWMGEWLLPLGQLSRAILATAEVRLGQGTRTPTLAASTASRYRKVAHSCIRRAVELGVLPSDPWPPAPKGRSQRKAVRSKQAVSVRDLPGPAAMVEVLDAMRSHQPASATYQLMTATAYYAGLRPSEVVMLRPRALRLPEEGWGRLEVIEADISFDEPGEPKTGYRAVPIPPVLVALLRTWIDQRGIGDDDLLFRTRNGNRPTPSNWARSFKRALRSCEQPSLRVYDCRHAAATTWLRAGVPLGEVAKRLGHSVETLVSTYVGAIAGDETLANDRIEAALADG